MPEKMQRPAEDKAVQPVEDKAQDPAEDQVEEEALKAQALKAQALKAEPQRRFAWEATSSDGKQAQAGPWRVRVQQLGGTGLWRPFVEYVGADYQTAEGAEKALERVLR